MVHRLDAGTQRYSVGIETPRFWATSRGDIPPFKSLRADSTFPGVIRRLRPPLRPRHRGQASTGSLGQQLPLHLRQRRHDVEEEAAGRGRSVDTVGRAAELDPAALQVGLIGEDTFAPGFLQGVELEVERLLVGRDPGVTDPHAAPPVIFLETHRTRTLARGRFREWFPRSGMPRLGIVAP